MNFENKKVIVTGHTGFKGSWLTAWLKKLGANVVGISISIPTIPSHYKSANLHTGIQDERFDICNQNELDDIFISSQPDFVFHLAAQPLVRLSYEDPKNTWRVNLMGTLSVLESLRKINKKCAAVLITSDKCYDNIEWCWGYRENDALGGPDPYSASKGAAELLIKSYFKSYFKKEFTSVRIASARAGNVIGGGDWAESRIVPDCVKAWSKNKVVDLRNPNATRPWQHVLEPLSGYLSLANSLYDHDELHGESFNFGPLSQQNSSVGNLVQSMSKYWENVRWNDVSEKNMLAPYESGLLKLNCDKALHFLNWSAALDFEETVNLTTTWYKSFYQDPSNILEFTNNQIDYYINVAKKKGILWAQ